MHEPTRIVLRLEIERDREPLTGRLSTPARPPVPFTGWVGLAAAIERLTAPPDAEAPAEKMGRHAS